VNEDLTSLDLLPPYEIVDTPLRQLVLCICINRTEQEEIK